MARPSDYTEELGNIICTQLADGKSLRSLCKEKGIPSKTTILRWALSQSPELQEFRDQYARSMQIRAELMAEEILEISDDDNLDIGFSDEGKPFVKGENIQRAKLRVDTRKWLMAKMMPKKYAEKIGIGGADGLPPVESKTEHTLAETDKEIIARALGALKDGQ